MGCTFQDARGCREGARMSQRTRYAEGFWRSDFIAAEHLISSVRIKSQNEVSFIIIFSKGKKSGEIVVDLNDADRIAELLIPKGFWRRECDFCHNECQPKEAHTTSQGELICTSCLRAAKAREPELECPTCRKKFAECECEEPK